MTKELLNQMKNPKIVKKPTFWTWLHRNRLRVAVLAFLILIPLALIFTAYIGSYTANRKVTFDAEITKDSVYIKEFINPDEINAFTLNIVWNELKHPVDTVGSQYFENGYYKFNITYEVNDNFNVKNVTVIPVLQTDWKNLRSMGSPVSLTDYPIVIVYFDYELPIKPLLFVTVNEPYLYLMVHYTLSSAGQDVEFTEYVRFSLSDLNPMNVIN